MTKCKIKFVRQICSEARLVSDDSAKLDPSTISDLSGQRIEQMYQLADIFASIFEALPNRIQEWYCPYAEGDITSHHEYRQD